MRSSIVSFLAGFCMLVAGVEAQEPAVQTKTTVQNAGPLEQPDDAPGTPAPRSSGPQPHGGPPTQGPYVSHQVNVDEFGNDIVGDAANEPSIAVDPTDPNRMAIGWRQFDTIASNFRQAGRGYSTDGGTSWTFPGVLEPGIFRSDPVLSFDADGRFYYNSLQVPNNDFLCDVFASDDGGQTYGAAMPAFGGDKAWMTVDRTNGIGRGNLYSAWSIFAGCCGSNTFTRSVDMGATWSTPIAIPLLPIWGTMSVGPAGELYVGGVWTNDAAEQLVAKSTNAQDPMVSPSFDFTSTVFLGGSIRSSAGPNPGGLLGQVWVAADPRAGSTNVYLLASVDPPGSDPLDVMFARSTDGGANWSAGSRVNDDPAAGNSWQWFGTMAVAPNGRIDVVWNNTQTGGFPQAAQVRYAYSIDEGSSWTPSVAVSPTYDYSVGYPNQNKMGDYYDMVSHEDAAHLAYAATFNGGQDVYYLRIAPDCNANGVHDGTDVLSGISIDCNANGLPDECEFPGCAGIPLADLNCDGAANGADIQPYVNVFASGGYTCAADMNQNGALESADTMLFANALVGP